MGRENKVKGSATRLCSECFEACRRELEFVVDPEHPQGSSGMSHPRFARLPFVGLKERGCSIQTVKEWREREDDAGRPSGFDDFLRAHGFCPECRGHGKKISGIRWRDVSGIEQSSLLGTEAVPVAIADLVERHKDAVEWNELYETCEVCGGTGEFKNPQSD